MSARVPAVRGLLALGLTTLLPAVAWADNLLVDGLVVSGGAVAGGTLPVQFDVVVSGARTPFGWAAYLSTTGARAGAVAAGTYGPVTPRAEGRMRVTGDVVVPATLGGRYYLVIELDPAGAVADTNPYDDSIASDQPLRITPRAADVRVLSLVPSTARARAGAALTVAVDVENTGNAEADTAVRVVIDRDGTPSATDVALGTATVRLTAGQRRTISVDAVVPAGLLPGAHVLSAVVDPDRTLGESDEADNVTIGADPLVVFEDRLALSTTSLPGGTVFLRYFARLGAEGGDGAYQYRVSQGALPTGLALGAASGELTGAPLASGEFAFTLEVSSDGRTAQAPFSLRVAPSGVALSVVTPDVPGGTLGLPYEAVLAAAGGEPPYVWTLLSGGVPPGLDLSTSGRIAGVPREEGEFGFTVEVSDAKGGRVRASFEASVAPANVVITSLVLPAMTTGEPVEVELTVKGGAAPYEWEALSTPPPGLTLGEDGTLSGTPSRVGRFTTRVRVSDAAERPHTDTALLIVEVRDGGGFELVVPAIPNLRLREILDVTLSVEGGKPPYQWRINAQDTLPDGFVLEPAPLGEGTAVLRGSSIRPVDQAFLIEVTDKTGRVRSAIVGLSVDPAESTASSGCTCVAPTSGGSVGSAALVGALGLVLALRRRRR